MSAQNAASARVVQVLHDASRAAARDASRGDEETRRADQVTDASRTTAVTRRAAIADVSRSAAATAPRACAWCGGQIPTRSRRDALCCSVRCRQARHRFTSAVGRGVASASALRLAYADPPYPGKAHLYRGHPDFAGEVDHPALIRRLSTYDGWALSTSAAALPAVLALCPPGASVAAWHRGERPARSSRPLNAWEPVIYYGGRATDPSGLQPRRVDSLTYVSRPRTTDPHRVLGAKPAPFCRWLFELLGACPGDVFDDLFPGSGCVAKAWTAYCQVCA